MRRGFRHLVVLLLVGCSGNGTSASPGGGDGGASLDALRAAFCKAARSCCAAAGSPPEPLATCESELDRQIPLFASVVKGTIVVDEVKLRACIARIDEQSRTCQGPEDVCVEAFSPTLSEGASCDLADECKEPNGQPIACVKILATADSGPTPGVCRLIPIGKGGDACAASCPQGKDCSATITGPAGTASVLTICREDDGLYCDSSRHCAPLLADGAPCTTGCASTSFCSAVCTPRKSEGSACASFAECRAGLACASAKCVPPVFATAKLCRGDYN
jgi:hypothetical protein